MNTPVLKAFESPKVSVLTVETCGSCKYAQDFKKNDNRADCFGMPPSVHVIGASQGPLGPQLQLETFVPRVHRDRPACSLYKRKQDFLTQGSS